MKINPLDNRSGVPKAEPVKESNKADGTFEATLNSQLKKSTPLAPPQVGNSVNVGLNPFTDIARNDYLRADSVKKAEGLLFSLEMYKNSLANTEIKPERLSELLTDMKEKSVDALRSGQSLPVDDPLRDILAEVRTVISNESRRFYSPDK